MVGAFSLCSMKRAVMGAYSQGMAVCIIEAMKLMNEMHAEINRELGRL
jgi:hypothetical protein